MATIFKTITYYLFHQNGKNNFKQLASVSFSGFLKILRAYSTHRSSIHIYNRLLIDINVIASCVFSLQIKFRFCCFEAVVFTRKNRSQI